MVVEETGDSVHSIYELLIRYIAAPKLAATTKLQKILIHQDLALPMWDSPWMVEFERNSSAACIVKGVWVTCKTVTLYTKAHIF